MCLQPPLSFSSGSAQLSTEQQALLARLRIDKYEISVEVNPRRRTFRSPVSLDIEHDECGGFVGVGLYDGGTSVAFYTDLVLAKEAIEPIDSFVAHNGKSDFEQLRYWGIEIPDSNLVWDTMLIGHIIDSSLKTYDLKSMSKRELDIEYPSYEEICGPEKSRITLDQQPLDIVANYNALDCYVTAKLRMKQMKDKGAAVYFEEIEKPASYVFQRMEMRGVRIDIQYLRSVEETLSTQRIEIEKRIKAELGDINLNSPKQLLGALNGQGLFPKLKNKSSTDKRALEKYRAVPVVSALLHYSELDTLLGSFVRPYLQRDCEIVHPFFNQCGTRTGRPSCSNPNLLQIPRRTDNGKLVRRMFIPREGFVMGDADFGQIEPRVLAHFSKDANLLKMFNDGVDFHSFTGEKRSIDREKAKILNLSVGYRASSKSVSQQLKCDEYMAQKEIDGWWELFPGLRYWQDKLIYDSRKSGYFTTLFGRRIRVENLTDANIWRREAAERQLINNITQGSAAEIMKIAMCQVDAAGVPLLVQVYDELLWESVASQIDEHMALVNKIMCGAVSLDVPLTADVSKGMNWDEAKN